MQTLDTTDVLESFRKLLPLTNVMQFEDRLQYKFKREASARYFEEIALTYILANGMPLVTDIEVWRCGGVVFEVNLIIALAPEETIAS